MCGGMCQCNCMPFIDRPKMGITETLLKFTELSFDENGIFEKRLSIIPF